MYEALRYCRDNKLPSQEHVTLLANFNQLYKIDPPTLELWIRAYNATRALMRRRYRVAAS